ncbi:hypothetical protein [Peribacillus loiseleuriae]|uniref:hypothetical protein n=1 Tax=Peribacillus loiseleuriae TaxID=1679170 RepID=UPI003CFDEE9F
MRTYNFSDVSISNKALSEQFQTEMSKDDVYASFIKNESGTVSFFIRQNQLQKITYPYKNLSLLEKQDDNGEKELSRELYDYMVSLLVQQIRETKQPYATCTLELMYTAKNNSFVEVGTCRKVEKHFKRS